MRLKLFIPRLILLWNRIRHRIEMQDTLSVDAPEKDKEPY